MENNKLLDFNCYFLYPQNKSGIFDDYIVDLFTEEHLSIFKSTTYLGFNSNSK